MKHVLLGLLVATAPRWLPEAVLGGCDNEGQAKQAQVVVLTEGDAGAIVEGRHVDVGERVLWVTSDGKVHQVGNAPCAATLLTTTAGEEDGEYVVTLAGGPQTICPVMGGEIDKQVFADHGGQRVYFCCPGCIAEFKKKPGQIIKQLENQGVKLERTPE